MKTEDPPLCLLGGRRGEHNAENGERKEVSCFREDVDDGPGARERKRLRRSTNLRRPRECHLTILLTPRVATVKPRFE